jgi:hypothetical protein
MSKFNPNDPMYFKTLGYELGSFNKRHNTEKTAKEVASNIFAGESQDRSDFILYYQLGVDSVEVLND